MKRLLLLEDGSVFEGEAFGADVGTSGEIVFSTGMTGYQESITDQSYNGQIITFTYPLIGNYGINRDDYESIRPTCKGVIVYEWAEYPSNWRQQMTFDEFLKLKGIPGISGIDTRALTKIIRKHGTMKACLINEGNSIHEALENLQKSVLLNNQIEQVSTKLAYASPGVGKNIVLVDFGLKHSILRELSQRQCHITVVPHTTTAQEILNLNPDGVLLSNGPGNPEQLPNALQMIQEIQGKIPIFGICMGHQLFAKANGAKTYKMTFGHRGFNHAVRHLQTGQVDFTSQNHGYAVSREDFPEALFITHEEINDKTVEGVRHKYYPPFTLQVLIENSYKHAFKHINKNNQLKVTIARNNDRLHIIVQDNGIGIPKEKLITLGKKTQISKKGSGTAIENLVRRLNIIYDGQASLKFESNDSGTCAIVNIPIKN